MISFDAMLRISAEQVTGFWRNFAPKAYVEPVVIVDGYHRYVLMSEDDYKTLAEKAAKAGAQPD